MAQASREFRVLQLAALTGYGTGYNRKRPKAFYNSSRACMFGTCASRIITDPVCFYNSGLPDA